MNQHSFFHCCLIWRTKHKLFNEPNIGNKEKSESERVSNLWRQSLIKQWQSTLLNCLSFIPSNQPMKKTHPAPWITFHLYFETISKSLTINLYFMDHTGLFPSRIRFGSNIKLVTIIFGI